MEAAPVAPPKRVEQSLSMLQAGLMLRFPQNVISLAIRYLLRYQRRKDASPPKLAVFGACLLLASKVGECPRRVRDVAVTVHHLYFPETDPPTGQAYDTLRADIIKQEQLCLRFFAFDLEEPTCPFLVLLFCLYSLKIRSKKFRRLAWAVLSDSFHAPELCFDVKCSSPVLAAACVLVSSKLLKKEPLLPSLCPQVWTLAFEADPNDVFAVAAILLGLYLKS